MNIQEDRRYLAIDAIICACQGHRNWNQCPSLNFTGEVAKDCVDRFMLTLYFTTMLSTLPVLAGPILLSLSWTYIIAIRFVVCLGNKVVHFFDHISYEQCKIFKNH